MDASRGRRLQPVLELRGRGHGTTLRERTECDKVWGRMLSNNFQFCILHMHTREGRYYYLAVEN